MFIARRIKRSLESSSCHVRAVVDQIEFISLFSLQLFHNFTVLDRVADVYLSVTAFAEGQSGAKEGEKEGKATKPAGFQWGFSCLPYSLVPAIIPDSTVNGWPRNA